MKRKQNIIKLLSMGLITLFSINGFAQCNASNLSQNIGNYVVGHVRVGQTFTSPCTGFIDKVKIDFNIIPITTGDRILRIKDGNTPSSPVIHTQTIPFNSIVIGTNTIVLTTPIPINIGEINGFEITEVVPNANSASGVAHNSPGNYLNGDAWFSGVNTLSGYDLTFQVEISNCGTLSPTGVATQTFCNSATINDLSATGSSIQWYATATGGSPLPGGTALTNGTTYYASQTVAGCESVNRLAVNAVINSTNTPTGTSTQTFCNSATINDLSATGSSIQWYATAIGGSPLPGGTSLTNGTTYYASQTVSGCESANRFAVNVVINSTATPTGTSTQTFCNSAQISDLSATGTAIQWYTAANGGSPLAGTTSLINGSTYYASQTVAGCESANRFAVNVVINSTATPTGTATQSFCNSPQISDLTATGTAIQWYTAASGGSPLTGTTSIVNGLTYYASQTVAGCESVNRLAVNVVINSTATPTGTATQTFCNSAQISDLSATGTAIQWYAAPSGGSPLAGTTSLVNGSTYYASQTVAGCESANRFAVNVVVNSTATPTGAATQSFCNSAQISDLTATGTAIQWYAAASGGSPLAGTTSLVNGLTYYASQTVSGCESANRFAVNAVISTVSDITTSVSGISITANNTNASYIWLDCNNNFSIIPGATAQTFTATTNGSYAVQLTENGCVDTSSCATITTVGLESIQDNFVLSIFPNPTDGVFSLNLGRTENEIITMISDVHSRIISYNLFNNKEVLTLDIEGPSGFYFVTVIAGNKQHVIKLIKN
jgi:hypothetical protein